MMISFPTVVCGALDFPTAAAIASRLGFDGVELHAFADPSFASASNALLTSTEKINRIFTDANAAISSLNVGSAGSELANRISLAAGLHCSAVRFECGDLLSRNLKTSNRAVDFIRLCADRAAANQITLLLENKPINGSANALWHLLDRINHPAVACCWNTLSAFIAGDSPAVAVPTLNSRIKFVLLADGKPSPSTGLFSDGPEGRVSAQVSEKSTALRAVAKLNDEIFSKVDLGTGEVPVRKTLDRLRGIGFQNGLIISPPMAASIEILEQSLQKSLDTLRLWNILPVPV